MKIWHFSIFFESAPISLLGTLKEEQIVNCVRR